MVRTNTARWSVWVETETTPDVYEEKMVALDDGTPDTTAATLRTDTIGRSEDEIFTVTTDQGVQSTHFSIARSSTRSPSMGYTFATWAKAL